MAPDKKGQRVVVERALPDRGASVAALRKVQAEPEGRSPAQFLSVCELSISKLEEVCATASGLPKTRPGRPSKRMDGRKIEKQLCDCIEEVCRHLLPHGKRGRGMGGQKHLARGADGELESEPGGAFEEVEICRRAYALFLTIRQVGEEDIYAGAFLLDLEQPLGK